MFRLLAALVLVPALMAGIGQAHAQSYPAKPIRIIVAFPAGGTADVLARLFGNKLSAALGQPVLVEYKTGAATMLGADYVAKSAADGYTLFLGSPSLWLNPVLYKKLPYKFEDFAPISILARTPFVIGVPPSLPASTLPEFIEWGKRQQSQVSYASLGVGGPSHLVSKLFEQSTGVIGVDIQYKGSASVMADLMAGRIHYYFDSIVSSLPLHRSGKIRVLAVASEQRSPAALDLPTFAELGYPKMRSETVYGLFAPAATPRATINQLSKAVADAALAEDLRARLVRDGTVPASSTPEGFAEIIRQDFDTWSEIIKASNIQLD